MSALDSSFQQGSVVPTTTVPVRIEGVPYAIRSGIDEIEAIQRRLGEGGSDHAAELERVVALCHDIRNKLQVLELEGTLRAALVRHARGPRAGVGAAQAVVEI